jgi:hypothetical protein
MFQSLAISVRSELMVEMFRHVIVVMVALVVVEFDDLPALIIVVDFVPFVVCYRPSLE